MKTTVGHFFFFLHFLNTKLATSTLRHLDNVSQIKQRGERKFRVLK